MNLFIVHDIQIEKVYILKYLISLSNSEMLSLIIDVLMLSFSLCGIKTKVYIFCLCIVLTEEDELAELNCH